MLQRISHLIYPHFTRAPETLKIRFRIFPVRRLPWCGRHPNYVEQLTGGSHAFFSHECLFSWLPTGPYEAHNSSMEFWCKILSETSNWLKPLKVEGTPRFLSFRGGRVCGCTFAGVEGGNSTCGTSSEHVYKGFPLRYAPNMSLNQDPKMSILGSLLPFDAGFQEFFWHGIASILAP